MRLSLVSIADVKVSRYRVHLLSAKETCKKPSKKAKKMAENGTSSAVNKIPAFCKNPITLKKDKKL